MGSKLPNCGFKVVTFENTKKKSILGGLPGFTRMQLAPNRRKCRALSSKVYKEQYRLEGDDCVFI